VTSQPTSPTVIKGFVAGRDLDALAGMLSTLPDWSRGSYREGVTGRTVAEAEVRDTDVSWLPTSSPIAKRIAAAVREITGETLPYDTPQVARYRAPAQHFAWHVDRGTGFIHRRWSAVLEVQSAPGGALEIEGWTGTLEPGDLVVFDAALLHRATAPSEGTRISLTIWFSVPRHDRPQRLGVGVDAEEDRIEAWPLGPSRGAVRRGLENLARIEATNRERRLAIEGAPWFGDLQAAVTRRRDDPDPRSKYPRGIQPLHEVRDWGQVLSVAGYVLLGYPVPPILTWDSALLTGTHRWLANEVLEELGRPERVSVEDVGALGLAHLAAMCFDRGFASASIQAVFDFALRRGNLDPSLWGIVGPEVMRQAEIYSTASP